MQRSNRDSARWIAGLLLLFVGLFSAAAVFFSFFSWAPDQSVLQKSVEDRELIGAEIENLCGVAGARLGMLLVDRSFGLFGILIPVMLVLIGIRIIRQRPLLVNHSILSLFFIMILGSLTLGFAFSDRWSICCSTGWGGAFGIEVSTLLRTHIGAVGTLILLLGGWILTGVFINRNFINKVNEVGNVMADKGEKIVEIVKHKVVVPLGRTPGEDGEITEETPVSVPKPAPKAAESAAPAAKAAAAPESPVQKVAAPIHGRASGGVRCGRESHGPGRGGRSLCGADARRKARWRGCSGGGAAGACRRRGVHRGRPFAPRRARGDGPRGADRAGASGRSVPPRRRLPCPTGLSPRSSSATRLKRLRRHPRRRRSKRLRNPKFRPKASW